MGWVGRKPHPLWIHQWLYSVVTMWYYEQPPFFATCHRTDAIIFHRSSDFIPPVRTGATVWVQWRLGNRSGTAPQRRDNVGNPIKIPTNQSLDRSDKLHFHIRLLWNDTQLWLNSIWLYYSKQPSCLPDHINKVHYFISETRKWPKHFVSTEARCDVHHIVR